MQRVAFYSVIIIYHVKLVFLYNGLTTTEPIVSVYIMLLFYQGIVEPGLSVFIRQGIARTQSPTTKNCTPEFPTFGGIADFSQARCTALASTWAARLRDHKQPASGKLIKVCQLGRCEEAAVFNTCGSLTTQSSIYASHFWWAHTYVHPTKKVSSCAFVEAYCWSAYCVRLKIITTFCSALE